MPRVAIFLPSLASGGAERVMLNLARGLLAHNHVVDMVLVQKTGSFLSMLPLDVDVVDLRAPRVMAALPALVRYLQRNRPDVLLSNMPHVNMVAVLAQSIIGYDVRLVLVEHVDLALSSLHGIRFWERWFPHAMKLLYPRADAVVAVSKGVADSLIHNAGIPEELITIIPNPVILPEIITLANEPLDHPWFQPGQLPVILAVGRLTLQKDYPTLLRAFAFLRSWRAVRLVILGEGELMEELKELAQTLGIAMDVDFAGFDPNPFHYMAHCNAFVLSSAWEGFGNVLVEAMACGAQVVATNCPSGPAEILGDGKYGRLVPVGDVTALASALEATLVSPYPSEVVRSRAKYYSIENIVTRYMKIFFSGSF